MIFSSSISQHTHSALERVLALAISSHGTPMSFVSCEAIVANALWLPWLVKSLEEEDVVAPADHTAYSLAEISLCILRASFGSTEIGSSYSTSLV
jgi:hypothetical protein